jgi:hypothetical protein
MDIPVHVNNFFVLEKMNQWSGPMGFAAGLGSPIFIASGQIKTGTWMC